MSGSPISATATKGAAGGGLPKLFQPLTIRGVTLPNRVALPPLCMYSCNDHDGVGNEWHLSHHSTFARGKVGLIFTEATAVEPAGRITPLCLGIWTDAHAEALKPVTKFIKDQGCVPGIQLAHAGRKASAYWPFHPTKAGQPLKKDDDLGNGNLCWDVVAPSAVPAGEVWPTPKEMSKSDLSEMKKYFVEAAVRSVEVAGYEVIELHMAHGYLLHSFLSPLSNFRGDEYGGADSLENRMRFPLEVTAAVRAALPDSTPLFVRLSAIDNGEGTGWSLEDSITFSNKLKDIGVDVIDCSSGGIVGAPLFKVCDNGKPLTAASARKPGFQVPLSEGIRNGCNNNATPSAENVALKTMAVGVIIDPDQAEEILQKNQADIVALGRELMYNPFWVLHSAQHFEGVDEKCLMWPPQYAWAVNRRNQIAELNKK